MKLIVITYPESLEHEVSTIHDLFEHGLELLHVRKPGQDVSSTEQFLRQLNPAYYNRVVLHQHHELASKFNIRRLHFNEHTRQSKTEDEFRHLKESGFTLSTSVHSDTPPETISAHFDYALCGPVFASISKPGYGHDHADLSWMHAFRNKLPLIAVGGISPEKLGQLETMGFRGAALLGIIWKNTSESVKQLEECQQLLHTH